MLDARQKPRRYHNGGVYAYAKSPARNAGHYLNAYVCMFLRDIESVQRLQKTLKCFAFGQRGAASPERLTPIDRGNDR